MLQGFGTVQHDWTSCWGLASRSRDRGWGQSWSSMEPESLKVELHVNGAVTKIDSKSQHDSAWKSPEITLRPLYLRSGWEPAHQICWCGTTLCNRPHREWFEDSFKWNYTGTCRHLPGHRPSQQNLWSLMLLQRPKHIFVTGCEYV